MSSKLPNKMPPSFVFLNDSNPTMTGRILSDAWHALLMRANVFEQKTSLPRRALAWANKPPTNGAREVARRVRQNAALFTVTA